MKTGEGKERMWVLIAGMAVAFAVLAAQLVFLQLVDNSYKISANNNALRYQTRYPARGLILDRNGRVLVGNRNTHDIIVTPYDVKEFDTAALCRTFSLPVEKVREDFRYYRKYRTRIGYQSLTFLKQVSNEQYSHFMEQVHKFPGFHGVPRTVRQYPYNAGGNLLGYVNEVDRDFLEKHPDYSPGDYVGRTGLEETCENMLRGEKGYSIFLRDARNVIQSPYRNGEFDKKAVPGRNVVSTIDAGLQSYGETLMQNKVGSIIAIEPPTGEILAMVSAPGISPSVLANINVHFKEIASDPFKPMFNRAVMSAQPPGSVFKLVNALIGLQEGVADRNTRHECHDGYYSQGLKVGCHPHKSPIDFVESIMMSCNAYYCELFRDILDNPAYGSVAEALDKWAEYVESFGFGRKLGSDFPSEQSGSVPSSGTYDRIYGRGHWSSLTPVSLSIGQGELGCTPLHLANLAAIIANRGYYIVPHIVRSYGNDSIDAAYSERHYTMIDTSCFAPVIEGMYKAVNTPYGQGATATVAAVDGLEICGKTGTAENPHGDEHSIFICFAPKDEPRIAVAVYLENAGFGAAWAAPVASLLVEMYLTGEISPGRKYLEDYITSASLLHKVPASEDYVPPKKDRQ